jgi:hypothetical protein
VLNSQFTGPTPLDLASKHRAAPYKSGLGPGQQPPKPDLLSRQLDKYEPLFAILLMPRLAFKLMVPCGCVKLPPRSGDA